MENPKKKKFIAKSIFMTHVRRIGWLRTAIGGGLMYVSVLEFIFLHLTTIIVLYKWLLTPLFRLKRFRIRDYIVLDRSKIEGMRAFDKLNCEFCGYANGTANLWNAEVDAIAEADLGRGNFLLKLIALLYTACLLVFLVFNFIFSKLLFYVISLFLGFHWADTGAIWKKLRATDYAGGYALPLRTIIRFAKLYAESLALNLEQIESSWCPLKHLETETMVPSDHHENFYDRDKLVEAIERLERDGSVSPRKPRY
jgi:hypothetical protein